MAGVGVGVLGAEQGTEDVKQKPREAERDGTQTETENTYSA